ncbi:minor capsid protein [Christensenellaceae bacterium OttesenSCG-928-L17]|nr:minor capsid protein [Christensenellaceae bacterium OttesenSCG-928-L17]
MAVRRRTNKYWRDRAKERLLASEKKSEVYLERINEVLEEARRHTTTSIRDMYVAYYKDKEGFDMQTLRQIVPSGDIKRFHDEMEALGLSTYLPDEYRGRISRLEMINAQLWAESHKAGLKQNAIETLSHSETLDYGYYRTIFDVSKGIGTTPAFSQMNSRTLNRILNTRFEGKNYSSRIWDNTDLLASRLQTKLAAAIGSGQSPAKTIREFQQEFGVSKYKAARLIRTETNYFENRAEIEAAKEMGIEKMQFLAVLDGRTSEICQQHDHTIIEVSKLSQGTNAPPLHPNCRSTLVPYIGKDYAPKERIYRDTDGKNQYVANMSYSEWRGMFAENIKNMVGSGQVSGIKGFMVATKFGATYDSFSLYGINSNTLKSTIDQSEYLLNEYPQVQEWVKEQDGLTFRASSNMKKGVYANTLRDDPIITLSRTRFKQFDKLVSDIKKGSGKGWFMPAKDYGNYVINHEFGHVMQNFILNGKNTTASSNRVENAIIEIAKSKFGLKEVDIPKVVSDYGKKNSREFFAEAFANLHSGKPNAIGRAMKEYLKGVLK